MFVATHIGMATARTRTWMVNRLAPRVASQRDYRLFVVGGPGRGRRTLSGWQTSPARRRGLPALSRNHVDGAIRSNRLGPTAYRVAGTTCWRIDNRSRSGRNAAHGPRLDLRTRRAVRNRGRRRRSRDTRLGELASRPLTIPRYSSFGHSPGGRRRAFQAKHLSLYATAWKEVHE